MFKIATWNVNSLRVRLPQVLQWLDSAAPDVLALQETKLTDEAFPIEALAEAGYQVQACGQRTYNGVAVLSREPGERLLSELPGFPDPQRRVLGMRFGPLRVLDLYVPNGASVGSEKYDYKLAWLDALVGHARQMAAEGGPSIILGDFNIAPEDADVHDPEAWAGQVLVSEPERERLRALLDAGFEDVFRRFEQPPESYSWWDYRQGAFRRNRGLRIDLVLADRATAECCRAAGVDIEPRGWKQPSDHAPVWAQFEFPSA